MFLLNGVHTLLNYNVMVSWYGGLSENSHIIVGDFIMQM